MKPEFVVSAVIGGKLRSVTADSYDEACERGRKAIAAGAAEAWVSRPFCTIRPIQDAESISAGSGTGVSSERPSKGLAPLARPDRNATCKGGSQ